MQSACSTPLANHCPQSSRDLGSLHVRAVRHHQAPLSVGAGGSSRSWTLLHCQSRTTYSRAALRHRRADQAATRLCKGCHHQPRGRRMHRRSRTENRCVWCSRMQGCHFRRALRTAGPLGATTQSIERRNSLRKAASTCFYMAHVTRVAVAKCKPLARVALHSQSCASAHLTMKMTLRWRTTQASFCGAHAVVPKFFKGRTQLSLLCSVGCWYASYACDQPRHRRSWQNGPAQHRQVSAGGFVSCDLWRLLVALLQS